MRLLVFSCLLAYYASCIDEPPPPPPPPPPPVLTRKDEGHLVDVRQITATGDGVRARWSTDASQLVLETRARETACARVERTTLADPPARSPVAPGESPSFLPGDHDVVYAASPSCAKPPSGAAPGDVIVDPGSDIVRAKLDGTDARKLAENPAFDGEPAVCPKSGAIVFTSTRDGDLDLYRMDPDGGHLARITATPGYDGGAAFDADCTHIAWHAWHPKGKDLEDYTKQLAAHAVHTPKLELWVANADGTDAHRVTYLEARSRHPVFYREGGRLLFTSTFGNEDKPSELDVWAIDIDGTNLERVTNAPGRDLGAAFSPDGKLVAFASERAGRPGKDDADVFVAHWTGAWRHVEERPADHLMGDAAWLADRPREGRGFATKGLEDAGAYIERSLKYFGLAPGDPSGYRQSFDVTTKVSAAVTLSVGSAAVPPQMVRALGFSTSKQVDAPLVFVASDADYARLDVKGKIVVQRDAGATRRAAWVARERGATGFLAVAEGALPEVAPQTEEGIVAAVVLSGAITKELTGLVRGGHPLGHLAVTLAPETAPAFNVIARYPASAPEGQKLPGAVVVGAHYDGPGEASPGADDNASGVAALLQVGRSLTERKPTTRRDIVLVAFSAEEQGAAGAAAFVRHPPGGLSPKDIVAMIDLDMVGRLRDDTVQVFGADSAAEWPDLLNGACTHAEIGCARATGGGVGGEDRRPFFDAGIPTIQLFTGIHADHGRPTDTADRLNAAGMQQVAQVAEQIARDTGDLGGHLTFKQGAAVPAGGEGRGFGASMGTVPDQAGPPNGQKGMLLGSVRPGGPADKAGLRKGDVVVRLGDHLVGNVDDVKFVLTQAQAGEHMKVVVLRDGRELTVDVTLDAPSKK